MLAEILEHLRPDMIGEIVRSCTVLMYNDNQSEMMTDENVKESLS